MSSGFRRAKNIYQRTTTAAYRSIWVLFVVYYTVVSYFLKHFFVQTTSCYMHTSQCAIYSTYTYHCLRIRRSKVEDSQNLEKVSMKMTYSKKQKITENNEKHSNRPVGRCSGPLVDIFCSMEPWTHALSKGLLGLSLNLNILGSKIEICAQNSAFLRKKGPHIT